MTLSLSQMLDVSAKAVKEKLGVSPLPDTVVVLGSGFKGFEAKLKVSAKVDLKDLPHFAVPRVEGHGAQLVYGKVGAREVLVLTGRVHLYEGHDVHQVVFPLRVLARGGVKRALLTNAAGSVDPKIRPGQVVALNDQINLTGHNCLTGNEAKNIGPQFLDMSAAYDPEWRAKLMKLGPLVEGVYAGLLGPTYETPAETAMLGRLGAHVVGMSTVQETIAARHLGMKVAGLSFVTNMAGGLGDHLSHKDVIELAEAHRGALHELLLKALGT